MIKKFRFRKHTRRIVIAKVSSQRSYAGCSAKFRGRKRQPETLEQLAKVSSRRAFVASWALVRGRKLQTETLEQLAIDSSRRAFAASRALGLTVSYIKEGVIYDLLPDGTVVKKRNIEAPPKLTFEPQKGMILHRKDYDSNKD